jgi:hypothetical protein
MEKLHLGLLLPSSTIFPISKQFEKGLHVGLGGIDDSNVEIEITKEFIGQGGTIQVEGIVTKLFSYDSVDLIAGIVSNRVIENIASKFHSNKKPIIVNNLGEHVPNLPKLNPWVFINSMHLWKEAFALGHWGVKTWGKKGMFIASVYDAGYSFSHMFHLGMMNASSDAEWSFSVPPMPPTGSLTDMSVIFPFLERYQPDFIFGVFCGKENTLFLNEFIKRGWHKKTKILGLPYLVSPFEPLIDDITVYTAQLLTEDSIVHADDYFYQLGHQTGDMINKASKADGATIQQKLVNAQQTIAIEDVSFSTFNHFTNDTTTIVENQISAGANNFHQKIVETTATFSPLNTSMIDLHSGISASWLNPYLCI